MCAFDIIKDYNCTVSRSITKYSYWEDSIVVHRGYQPHINTTQPQAYTGLSLNPRPISPPHPTPFLGCLRTLGLSPLFWTAHVITSAGFLFFLYGAGHVFLLILVVVVLNSSHQVSSEVVTEVIVPDVV